jgi:putative transcriptional regulator
MELQANGWLNCPADAELIFNTAADLRYEMALRRIGIEPAMLSMETGHA